MDTGANGGEAFVIGFFVLWGLLAVVGLAALVFWVVEIIDVVRREFSDQNTKIVWLLVVVLLHGLGALIKSSKETACL